MARINDTDFIDEKVHIRIDSLNHLQKKELSVLDAFGGDGLVWKAVTTKLDPKSSPPDIGVVRIDRDKKRKGFYLIGDNVNVMNSINLQAFDIIDLDCHGSPYMQLQILFKRKYHGLVHCSFIPGLRGVDVELLLSLKYTRKMIEAAPLIFKRNAFARMMDYLGSNGVREIHNYQATVDKNYFYFLLPGPGK